MQPALKEATRIDLSRITRDGRLAGCLIRHSLLDLNTEGEHREGAKEWFYEQGGAASLAVCSRSLANLNRFLSAHAPADRSALPHLADIMPGNVQDPLEWQSKLLEIAEPETLDPGAISRRHRAARNIEALADALVDECREVHAIATQEHSIEGVSLPKPGEPTSGSDFVDPDDGPIMRL